MLSLILRLEKLIPPTGEIDNILLMEENREYYLDVVVEFSFTDSEKFELSYFFGSKENPEELYIKEIEIVPNGPKEYCIKFKKSIFKDDYDNDYSSVKYCIYQNRLCKKYNGDEWEEVTTKLFWVYFNKFLPNFQYLGVNRTYEDVLRSYFNIVLMRNGLIDTMEQTLKEALNPISKKINDDIVWEGYGQISFEKNIFKTGGTSKLIDIEKRGAGFSNQLINATFKEMVLMSQDYLESQKNGNSTNVIFAFEEPETHLHPSAQVEMYNTLKELSNHYQTIITTHSPTIVSQCDVNDLIQVKKNTSGFTEITSKTEATIRDIIADLGVTPNSDLLSAIGFADVFVFVEGKHDVYSFPKIFNLYKKDDIKIAYILLGGCDSVKHWSELQLVKQLNKPYFYIVDSDYKAYSGKSICDSHKKTREKKIYDFSNKYNVPISNFHVLKKRELENYILPNSVSKFYNTIYSKSFDFQSNYTNNWNYIDLPLVVWVEYNSIKMDRKNVFSTEEVAKEANKDGSFISKLKSKFTNFKEATTGNIGKYSDKIKDELNSYFFEKGNVTLSDLDFKYIDDKGNEQDEFVDIYNKIKSICGK